MTFAGMNYIAIVVAAITGFFFGGIYYTLLSKQWLSAVGLTKEKIGKSASTVPYVIVMVSNLVMAWVLAGAIGHLGPGQVSIRNGLISAGFLWVGFIVTTIAANNAFGQRKPMLTIIDSGHWLGALLIMGVVIGAFGV